MLDLSSLEDIKGITMSNLNEQLLTEIDAFLAKSGMSESYFGKRATGNSELVKRLRDNGTVTLKTAGRVRDFIRANPGLRVRTNGDASAPVQDAGEGA